MEYRGWCRENRTWLCEHTPNLTDLMRHLRSMELLTEDKQAEIEREAGLTKQCELLYDHLFKFPVERIADIIHCLKESQQPHVANRFMDFFNAPGPLPARSFWGQSPIPNPVWFEVRELACKFVGRDSELVELHRMFTQSRNTDSIDSILDNVICISGLGGIGKSSLARKYARKKESFYNGNVIWINAENVESLKASFSRLTIYLHRQTNPHSSAKDVGAVYEALKNVKKVLIIFDNVEDIAIINPFLPKLGHPGDPLPYMLVTSRKSDLVPLPGNQLRLEALKIHESVQFIRERLHNCTASSAAQLANTLGGFPLTTQQAVAYIRETYIEDGDQISKYLKEFETSSHQLLNDTRFQELFKSEYSHTTWTVWNITLAKIRESCEPSYDLLKIFAHLLADTSINFLRTVLVFEEIHLKYLTKYSLVTVHNDRKCTISVHRVLQHVLRLGLVPNEQADAIRQIAAGLRPILHDSEDKTIGRESLCQALHLMRLQLRNHELTQIGFDYMDAFLGLIHTPEICAALAQQPYTFPPEIPSFVDSRQLILSLQQNSALVEQALPVCKVVLGDNNKITANILMYMASMQLSANDVEVGLDLFDEALSRLGNENGRQTLLLILLKASLLHHLKRFDEAVILYQHLCDNFPIEFGEHYFTDLRSIDVVTEKNCRKVFSILWTGLSSFHDNRCYADTFIPSDFNSCLRRLYAPYQWIVEEVLAAGPFLLMLSLLYATR